jgi:membrane-bound ClpP family serine protease
MKIIRNVIFGMLCMFTLWLVFRAATAQIDPGYGRWGAIMSNGLIAFVVWIPYNIICMFADGNKPFGFGALGLAGVAMASLGIIILADRFGFNVFGFHVIALLFLPIALVAIWILSAMNFIKKTKQNHRLHSIAGSARSE